MRGLLYKNLIFLMIFVLVFGWTNFIFSDYGVIESTIKISVCGNGIPEGPEECDFYYENSEMIYVFKEGQGTCQDLDYDFGTLACDNDCTFNIEDCGYDEPTPPSSPPTGGGGGGPTQPETGATFSGRAYPNQSVTLLKDAQVAATTIAGSDANFSMRITGLTAGNYIFSLYSEDQKGIRSSLLTFPLSITQGTITNVTGIFIAPSIDVDKSEVRRGDDIVIFGQSAPEANITIQVSGSPDFFAQAVSDEEGVYLHYFNTAFLDYHTYYAKSKVAIGGTAVSSFSKAVSFLVGTKNVLKEKPGVLMGDLNKDDRVNLVDFSIAAYWYRKTLSPEMKEIECERLNCDATINLTDFSIMAYYWTG